jgi:hypothetical protein
MPKQVSQRSLFPQEKNDMRKQSLLVAAAMFLSTAIPATALALPSDAQFRGKVLDIFVNSGSVLVQVEGTVQGPCTGSFENYNLTFDISDGAAEAKLSLIRDAFLNGKIIAGYVGGCSSSLLNRLDQVGIANP